jgi:hypothetical protein
MHRADQIIEAVVSALEANASLDAVVYAHRAVALSEDESELPAVSVTFGEDAAEAQISQLIYSTLDVQVTAYCAGDDEAEVKATLLEMRAQIHVAMMTSTRLGLSFVHLVNYGGATAPQIEVGERTFGALTSSWRVRYEMSYSDPS